VVETQILSQDLGIAAKRFLPKPVADYNLQCKSWRLVLRIKRATQLRFNAKQCKIICRHIEKRDPRRLRQAGEIDVPNPDQSDVFKNPGAFNILTFHPRYT